MSKSILKGTKKSRAGGKEKVPVTFNQQQLALIEQFMGILGNTKAEIVRNIVINWLLGNKKEKDEK